MTIRSIISRLFRAAPQQPAGQTLSIFAAPTSTGITVTPDSALRCSAVLACVRVIADTVASLPLRVYRRRPDGGRDVAADYPLYRLLHDAPNAINTSYEWREVGVSDLLLRGNWYSEIERNGAGQVIGLWRLNPDAVQVSVSGTSISYTYRAGGKTYQLPPDKVLHIRGFSRDGITGISPIEYYAESIATNIAAQKFTGKYFQNGANAGKVLEYPGRLDDEAITRLRTGIQSQHAGIDNAHRIMILEEGMKLREIGVAPRDSQLLELLQFSVVDIARAFRLPAYLIGGDTKTTSYASLEQEAISFLTHSIRPWLVRIEQALNKSLLAGTDYYAEFLVDALLRVDTKTRYEAYAIARQNGWLNADEIRLRENMNPLPDGTGQTYIVPLNMAPATQPDGTPPTDSGSRRTAPAGESRSKSTARRRKIIASYEPVIEDAIGRIVRREKRDVAKLVKKHLSTRDSQSLVEALQDFYRDDHRPFVARNSRKVLAGLMAAMFAEISDDYPELDADNEKWQQFVRDYLDNFATRYTLSSYQQLRDVITRATEAGDDVAEAVTTRLDEWEDRRPAKEAKNESVRAGNAAARTLFAIAGVTKLIWRANANACPICQEMDGRVVGVEHPFAAAGEKIGDLTVSSNVSHAPLHGGCNCTVEPA